MPISFACGTCGKPYKVDERFAGKKAACRACGTVNNIPTGKGTARVVQPDDAGDRSPLQREPVRVADAANDGDENAFPLGVMGEALELADAPEPEPPVAKPAPRRVQPVRALPVDECPNCGSALDPGAVFCTGCGFNLKTRQKVSTTVAEEPAEPDHYDPSASVRRDPTPTLRTTAFWLLVSCGVF